jgi:hypothetical protein
MSTTISPPAVLREHSPTKGFNVALFVARLLFWAWTFITKILITLTYWFLMSQALKVFFPEMGTRLYSLPGFAFMKHYTALYRIDLSHVFSAVPLLASWALWHLSLEMYLRPELFAARFQRWDLETVKKTVIAMTAIILTGDAMLFATAFTLARWGGPKVSYISAALATLVYVSLLGFVTFVGLYLSDAVENHKKENRP